MGPSVKYPVVCVAGRLHRAAAQLPPGQIMDYTVYMIPAMIPTSLILRRGIVPNVPLRLAVGRELHGLRPTPHSMFASKEFWQALQ